jgi:hypothetical protein
MDPRTILERTRWLSGRSFFSRAHIAVNNNSGNRLERETVKRMADYRHMTIEERIEYHKQQIALHENSINALEGLLRYNVEGEKKSEKVKADVQPQRKVVNNTGT